MNFKCFSMLALSAFAGALFAAEIPLPLTEFNINPKLQDVKDSAIVLKSRTQLTTKKMFKLDPAKKYALSGSIKGVAGAADNNFYAGFMFFDANKKPIQHINVITAPDTFTSIVADVDAKDTVIKVKDASKWNKLQIGLIAVNAKADNSDLPNRNIIPHAIKKIEKKGDIWELTLIKPVGKALKAGTNLRLHRRGGYFYTCSNVKNSKGLNGATKLRKIGWPGAVYYRIIVLANWSKVKPGEAPALEIKDLKILEQ